MMMMMMMMMMIFFRENVFLFCRYNYDESVFLKYEASQWKVGCSLDQKSGVHEVFLQRYRNTSNNASNPRWQTQALHR